MFIQILKLYETDNELVYCNVGFIMCFFTDLLFVVMLMLFFISCISPEFVLLE